MLKKIKDSPKGIKLWIVLILFLTTFLFSHYYYFPTWKNIRETKEEILLLQNEIEESHLYLSQTENELAELPYLEESVAQLESQINSIEVLEGIFTELEAVLLNSYFEGQAVEIGEIFPYENSKYHFFIIDHSFKGEPPEILDYFNNIETDFYGLKINKVEIQREENLYFVNLQLIVFLSP